jgi:putative proteasome-type protease
MTYCVGLLVDTGLVMLSDSGTSAGVDQVNTFRKMATFRRPKDRVLVLMSAGNLAIAQAVTHVLQEEPEDHLERAPIFGAPRTGSRPHAWRDALREIQQRDGKGLREQGHESNGTLFRAARSKVRSRACFTSTRPATSSNHRSTRPIFRSANRNTAGLSSTG